MNHCRYCTHLGWPEMDGTAWEPIPWTCTMGLTVVEGEHACVAFEREVGSDDDMEGADAPRNVRRNGV